MKKPQRFECLFCNEPLPDFFIAFYDHVSRRGGCKEAWYDWMGNVRREAGGT
jgi:hypothetical protein